MQHERLTHKRVMSTLLPGPDESTTEFIPLIQVKRGGCICWDETQNTSPILESTIYSDCLAVIVRIDVIYQKGRP